MVVRVRFYVDRDVAVAINEYAQGKQITKRAAINNVLRMALSTPAIADEMRRQVQEVERVETLRDLQDEWRTQNFHLYWLKNTVKTMMSLIKTDLILYGDINKDKLQLCVDKALRVFNQFSDDTKLACERDRQLIESMTSITCLNDLTDRMIQFEKRKLME